VLVERFLRIVRESLAEALPQEQRAGVGEILVITFTEKATKEMKRRIVEELTAAGLREQRREVETAYISTIHGFCSRLLKENPFEAGVDPEFTVLDETEARRLLHGAFEAVVEQAFAIEDGEITELVASAQDERVFGSDLRDPLSALEASVKSALDRIRGAGIRQEELAGLLLDERRKVEDRLKGPVVARINHVVREIEACRESLSMLRTGVMGALEAVRRDVLARSESLDELGEGATWERIAATVGAIQEVVKAALRGSRARSQASESEMAAQQALARIQAAAEAARELYNLTVDREEEADVLCRRFLRLVSATWDAYNEAKRREGALDNEDLQSEAVHLLKTAPGVLRRYRRRFRYLMVDEFQDTNPLQMELIDLLHPASGPDVPNRLFVVGDVQQSIYGFRNADAALFQKLERDFRSDGRGRHVTLADNFRARPELLQFVNYLFEQIWRGAPTPFTPLTPGAKHAPKRAPSVEFLVTRDTGRPHYIATEARALARRIRRMVERQQIRITDCGHPRFGQPVGYSDIAILMRGLTDIERYEKVFLEEGVPYFVVGGGRGYYARAEVRDIMNVLTVIDTPLDDLALVATLRSPMAGLDTGTLYALARFAQEDGKRVPIYPRIPDFVASGEAPAEERAALGRFHETMEKLRAGEDRGPVGRLLERILAETRYDAKLLARPAGRRRLANVRKLLQMASASSTRGVGDFVRRLREIEKLSDREGDAPTEEEASDVVRILTIHKAKGLEFPVVFVADLGRALGFNESALFVCDPRSLAVGCKLNDYQTAAYRTVVEERKRREREEANRLLYVALTRAREHLVLCGATQSRNRDTWASMVFGHMAVTQPDRPQTRIGPGGIATYTTPMEALTGGTEG
jgi:ATP-dependent helicase/nuclease subunit A